MLKDLTARYAFCVDYPNESPISLESLFVEDGRYLLPLRGVELIGRAAIRDAFVRLAAVDRHLHHVQTNHVFDIDGQSAKGRCEFNEFITTSGAVIGYSQGWYEDEYVWENGSWWFSVRKTHLTEKAFSIMTSKVFVDEGLTFVDKLKSDQ